MSKDQGSASPIADSTRSKLKKKAALVALEKKMSMFDFDQAHAEALDKATNIMKLAPDKAADYALSRAAALETQFYDAKKLAEQERIKNAKTAKLEEIEHKKLKAKEDELKLRQEE